jgi:predicted O-linked N-acetylglucosamine transferase (SPINDLY family)
VTLQELERLDEAAETLRRALSLNSDYAQASNNLGNVLKMQGLLDESEACYRQALASNPAYARCYNNLGVLLQESNSLEEAEVCLRQAIKLNPKFADGHSNLGQIFYKLGRLSEAITSYKRVIELKPSYALAHQNLGEVLMLQRKWEESLACYEHARSLNPNLDYLLGDSIHVQQKLCDWDALPENIEELVTRTNNNERVSLPFILQALVDCPETIQKGTEIFSKHNHPRSDVLPKIGIYQDHEKIRIGYFSPDFCKHPVTTGIADLFKLHDRENFEVHAFSFGPDIKDQWNTKVREGVDFYHDIRMMSDKGVASLSRSLEIDIAVDLTGHTKNNRTGIFAIGAALVQIGFMGFLGTMGASYYDYIFADTVVIPETQKDYYTEKIAYLPSCQVNSEQIDSPDTLYDRKHFGISEDSFVFCCFNQSVKITPDVFDSWSRILGQVKNSLLMLYVDNDKAAQNLKNQISIRGIDPDRLIFGDRLSGSQYWSRYQVVDLFLDTFTYSAGMTASDALRMGCPMITKMGDSFTSRFGASILSAVGLPELITTTQAEYEALVIYMANTPEKFEALKEKLLVNLSTEVLYDTQTFAYSIEQAYVEMYKRCQDGKEPIDIYIEKNHLELS